VITPSPNDAPGRHHLGCCPACNTHGAGSFASGSGVHLRRCPNCTLVYVDPQSRGEVRTRYLEEYDLAAHFEHHSSRKQVLFQRRLESIGPPPKGRGRLFDVGCADGQFIELAQGAGWETSGIELNPPAVAKARERGATVVEGALEDVEDLEWRAFDVVTSWDVLEHTPTPSVFAEKLACLVAPGGSLFITTLNWASLVRRIRGMRWSMIADEHFTYWTVTALGRLFERENMELRSIETFGLGRDLVAPLDSLAVRLQRVARTGRGRTAAQRPTWDTSSAVLFFERATNAVLRWTGSGVGLAATFRAPRG
jgi:2-polyprenyl-3-methyl-5-hydroxy-6-metoxy-1,4-benzoquinol methylase